MSSPFAEEGSAALRAGDAVTARRAFESALAEVESGEVLEGLAEALYLERDYAASAAHYERAYAAYRRERQSVAAGRAARTVAWITGNVFGQWAVQSGWWARARTILEEAGEDGSGRGWLLIIRNFSEPDARAREVLLRDAVAVRDRAGRGRPALRPGDARAARRRHDPPGGAADPAGPRRGGGAAAGRPPAAPGRRGRARHPPSRRGETALARNLLERATARPDDRVPPVGESTMAGPLLALLVDVLLEQGDLEDATRVAERLDRMAGRQRGPYLRAAAAFAKGRVCLASGQGDAVACLHEALEGFARAQLPMELARTRLEMAQALAEPMPEVAIAEAKAALKDFERLEATRSADAAGALLRSLGAPIRTGPKGIGALTRRETEILRLIGAGLSNPEIADRLYITRKTVETHVGNLLAKLGLRNRAEAAAYVTRQQLSL